MGAHESTDRVVDHGTHFVTACRLVGLAGTRCHCAFDVGDAVHASLSLGLATACEVGAIEAHGLKDLCTHDVTLVVGRWGLCTRADALDNRTVREGLAFRAGEFLGITGTAEILAVIADRIVCLDAHHVALAAGNWSCRWAFSFGDSVQFGLGRARLLLQQALFCHNVR